MNPQLVQEFLIDVFSESVCYDVCMCSCTCAFVIWGIRVEAKGKFWASSLIYFYIFIVVIIIIILSQSSLCIPSWSGTQHEDQAGPKFKDICLPLLPEYWVKGKSSTHITLFLPLFFEKRPLTEPRSSRIQLA